MAKWLEFTANLKIVLDFTLSKQPFLIIVVSQVSRILFVAFIQSSYALVVVKYESYSINLWASAGRQNALGPDYPLTTEENDSD